MTSIPVAPSQLSLKESTQTARPEIELLLCCARIQPSSEISQQIQNLVQQSINWDFLLQTAARHCILPLLYQNLKTLCPEAVPKSVLSQFRIFFNTNAQHNLFLTQELLNLLKLFDEHDIPVIPFKGPVLAALAYGNLALRQFGDLDILVNERDYPRAEELLISQRYYPPPEQNTEWERCFVNYNRGVHVDLHRKLTPWYLPFSIDFEGWWERRETVFLLNTNVLSFSSEDLLIILCVQVAKDSQWRAERLSKICDLAELLHTHQDLDWKRVWQQCIKLGSKRMLLFSLYLASELLGTDLPEEILLKMQTDKIAQLACVQVCEELFDNSRDGFEKRVFLMKLGRERWQDKIQYFFRIAIIPNEKDLVLLPLPRPLYFLYYLLRPIRLIGKYNIRLVQELFSQLRMGGRD